MGEPKPILCDHRHCGEVLHHGCKVKLLRSEVLASQSEVLHHGCKVINYTTTGTVGKRDYFDMSKMNLPNRLTLLRVILVPVFVACILYIPNAIAKGLVSCAVFGLASLTDMLDGKIARKYNLITNFGKFMDSLADKFMIFAALVVLTVTHSDSTVRHVLIWVTLLVIFRELGVTSIRLVCSATDGKVIAASYFGKLKTVSQMACIIVLLLEPVVREAFGINTLWLASYIFIGVMAVMTLASGIDYFKTYAPYLDSNK